MRRQSTTAVFISTVGELRQFLAPWTDECEITELLVNYYVRMNGDGALKVRIATDTTELAAIEVQQRFKDVGDIITQTIEECAEVIHILCKVQRFGWNNYHPADELKTRNYTHVSCEIADLEEKIARLKIEVEKQASAQQANTAICPCCTGDGIGADESGWVRCRSCGGTGKQQ